MKVVKIGEARNHLSRYLAYVRRGGRVRILDRNTPVADLVPVPEAATDDPTDQWLASLELRGIVRRGAEGRLPRELLREGPADPGGVALQHLLDERAQGR